MRRLRRRDLVWAWDFFRSELQRSRRTVASMTFWTPRWIRRVSAPALRRNAPGKVRPDRRRSCTSMRSPTCTAVPVPRHIGGPPPGSGRSVRSGEQPGDGTVGLDAGLRAGGNHAADGPRPDTRGATHRDPMSNRAPVHSDSGNCVVASLFSGMNSRCRSRYWASEPAGVESPLPSGQMATATPDLVVLNRWTGLRVDSADVPGGVENRAGGGPLPAARRSTCR